MDTQTLGVPPARRGHSSVQVPEQLVGYRGVRARSLNKPTPRLRAQPGSWHASLTAVRALNGCYATTRLEHELRSLSEAPP
jgi:hypothetical protein